jgi:hypothetical protein
VLASGGSQRWETHCLVTHDGFATPAEDILLATTPVDAATFAFNPYIGDYDDLQAQRDQFFGIFFAHNLPGHAKFPPVVRYQRNANFVTKQLLTLGRRPWRIRSIRSTLTPSGKMRRERRSASIAAPNTNPPESAD